jgi:hypothetical protein
MHVGVRRPAGEVAGHVVPPVGRLLAAVGARYRERWYRAHAGR